MTLHQKGFTLVELLVVVVVIGILAALAAPAFTTMIEKRRILAALENVHSHIQFARSESVKLGRDAPLNLSVKTGTPWCLGIDNSLANCDCTINPEGGLVDKAVTPTACGYGPPTPTGLLVYRNLSGADYTNVSLATASSNLSISSDRGDFATASETITLTSSPSGYEGRIVIRRLGNVSLCTVGSLGGYPACP